MRSTRVLRHTGRHVDRGRKTPDTVIGITGRPHQFIALCIRDPRAGLATTIDPNDCWIFDGVDNGHGYKFIRRDGRNQYAHRYMYELLVGPIPDGLTLDHLCRNRGCCNPIHLEPVTSGENSRRRPPVETCPHDHPMTGDNVYTRPSGLRECRICRAANRVKAGV